MHSQVEEGAERRRAHPLASMFGPQTDQDVDCACSHGLSTSGTISGERANDSRAVALFERELITTLHDQIVDAADTATYTAAVCSRARCDEDGILLFEMDGRPVLAAEDEPCDAVIVEVRVCFEKRSLPGSATRS